MGGVSIRAKRRFDAKIRVEKALEAKKQVAKVACMAVKAAGNDFIVDKNGIYHSGFAVYPANAGIRLVPVELIRQRKVPLRMAEVVTATVPPLSLPDRKPPGRDIDYELRYAQSC